MSFVINPEDFVRGLGAEAQKYLEKRVTEEMNKVAAVTVEKVAKEMVQNLKTSVYGMRHWEDNRIEILLKINGVEVVLKD